MSIAKPFTFVANTYAKASEVNANFDTVYSQVNSNISAIAQNATDIENLENNKADINGSSAQRFAVADAITSSDAINKQMLFKAIGNTLDYISGLVITKDSGSPEDTIIVSAGSAYNSTNSIVLSLANSLSKQNLNQAASATYYVYIIGSANGSLTDILISTSSTTPTLPSGYTLFRLIGGYTTNSDSEIDSIFYYGFNANSDKSVDSIIDSCMPDYSSGIQISSGATAPSAGFCTWSVYTDSSLATIYVNGVGVGSSGYSYGNQDGGIFPVAKGDTVTWSGSFTVKFYPAKGNN